jgi:exopolysaccharide production protein ExoQ
LLHSRQREQGLARSPRSAAQSGSADFVGWIASFISFSALVLNQWAYMAGVGMASTLLFLAPWLVIVLRRPNAAIGAVCLNWPLLMLPVLATVSALWSNYPEWSLRAGIQFIVTIVIGILAGSCIKPRDALSAFMSALTLVALLSELQSAVSGSIIALFGSKNYFSLCIALLIVACIGVALDRSQHRVFRAIGMLAVALSPGLLLQGNSLGATFAAGITASVMLGIFVITKFPVQNRAAFFCLFAFTLIWLVVLASTVFENATDVLPLLGKEATLTGRTVLWDTAMDSFPKHPFLGVGFQAFWQVGNWRAEQLWLYSHIPGKSGFHFHNTYLQVLVDLGLVGLFVLVATFSVIIARIFRLVAFFQARPEQVFAIGIFVFFLMRTTFEVDLLWQFQVPSILMCMVWAYMRPGLGEKIINIRRKSQVLSSEWLVGVG